jgi:hypothetical protein
MWWLLRTWWWFLLTTVTVWLVTRISTGVCAWVRWRMRKIAAVVAVGVALGSAV